MELSPEQDKALVAVEEWLNNSDQQTFRLFGYAGTGKTTLARYFAEQLSSGRAVFGAFTGKAAYVLRTKGCVGATTIHKLIYNPRDKSKAHLRELEDQLKALEESTPRDQDKIDEWRTKIKDERNNVARPMFTLNLQSVLKDASVKLIVIDECSMVDAVIGKDLESFEKKILVLGDPAQLPPVKGTGYFTEQKPDIMLTEIHRQARDNPIIRLATQIRKGEKPSLGNYGESKVVPKSEMQRQWVLDAGQVLVGTNDTRRAFNAQFRRLLNRTTSYPEPTDKLVCLRNNHELGLLNGSIWRVIQAATPQEDKVLIEVRDELEGVTVECEAHRQPFVGEDVEWYYKKDAEEFDYGYALTVHKAQGSQWDDVLIFDESNCFRQNRAQWLYTAITRAAERVTLVMQ